MSTGTSPPDPAQLDTAKGHVAIVRAEPFDAIELELAALWVR